MKKILILSMAAFLVFGFTSMATADLSAYYAVNGSDSSPVTISFNAITSSQNGTFVYDIVGDTINGWSPVGSGFSVYGVIEKTLVLIGLELDENVDTNATLDWQLPKDGDPNTNLFRYVKMTFAGGNTYQIASDPHYVSTVPLPGAVLLLGTGLIGLVGVRRKFRD